MKSKKNAYNPEVELAKGAKLEAASYDKTQKIVVIVNKVTVGGRPGEAVVSGLATGRTDASIHGCLGIWLSIFRYMRPDGATDHVAGWNIMLPLLSGQTPETTARAFAGIINGGTRPYRAEAQRAKIKITFKQPKPAPKKAGPPVGLGSDPGSDPDKRLPRGGLLNKGTVYLTPASRRGGGK